MSNPPTKELNIVFASFGNDSIALCQWLLDNKLPNIHVAYQDTKWGATGWPARVKAASKWLSHKGIFVHLLESEGMVQLVRRKNAFPRGGGGRFQFCTQNLKEKVALDWMSQFDPAREAICWIGIRAEESRNRTNFPQYTEESQHHGGRTLCAPLVPYTEHQRNFLINKTPLSVLPHKSKECWPCVNAGKRELKQLDEEAIVKIETLEKEMGINSKGNPIVMFSPRRHRNAIGIRAVVADAKISNVPEIEANVCTSGWCGI